MIKGGKGGGNTKTGLLFEDRVSILDLLKSKKGYSVKKNIIYYNNEEVALCLGKNKLYKWLESQNIDYSKIISKKLLPDEAIYVIINNTLYVVEVKFQHVAGSVDEKLQTCDFKRKQYARLMAPLNIEVEYIYILNDWFRKPEYKDVLDYIISVGCQYYFEYLPLQKLGLPIPE
ncbi:MAG: hypothetical protein PHS16_02360 [Candidatus Colwellbacteria bacterium]|jgi:hypothetical protein|nr:hypothetical protein [Candidatus Colwellbacteria bacterium]MDD3752754.1 hypothetical protein [Candidatus Colwellbacteria bacterium]